MARCGGALDPFVRNCGALFKLTASGSLQPAPAISRVVASPTTRRRLYVAAGRLVGAALARGVPLAHRFARFFCRRIVAHAAATRLRAVDLPTARAEGLIPSVTNCAINVLDPNGTGGATVKDHAPFAGFEIRDAVILPRALKMRFLDRVQRRSGGGGARRRGATQKPDSALLSFTITARPRAPKFVASSEIERVPLEPNDTDGARSARRRGDALDVKVSGALELDVTSLPAAPLADIGAAFSSSPALGTALAPSRGARDPFAAAEARLAAVAMAQDEAAAAALSTAVGAAAAAASAAVAISRSGETTARHGASRKRLRGGADDSRGSAKRSHEKERGVLWRDAHLSAGGDARPAAPTAPPPAHRTVSGACFPMALGDREGEGGVLHSGVVGTVVLPRWMLAALEIRSGDAVDLTPQHAPGRPVPDAATITVEHEVNGVACISELPLLAAVGAPPVGGGSGDPSGARAAPCTVSQLERSTVVSVGTSLLVDVVRGVDDDDAGVEARARADDGESESATQTLSFATVRALANARGEPVTTARFVPPRTAAEEATERIAFERDAKARRDARLCPNNGEMHTAAKPVLPLARFTCDTTTFRCDHCDVSIAVGARLYSCRVCDFDLCVRCRRDHVLHLAGPRRKQPSAPTEVAHAYAGGTLDDSTGEFILCTVTFHANPAHD